MIDFHSHIVFNIDDGSKSLDMSIDMLKLAESEGTRYICATSHFIPGDVEQHRSIYDERLSELQREAKGNGLNIKILPALELYMHPDLPKLYKENKVWGINNTKYVLIEFPMQQFPRYTEDVLYELRILGAVPIIAHPERNLKIMKDYALLTSMLEQGALAQVNAGSLRGSYGKDIKCFAEKLVGMNMIHMVGSDAHDDRRRTAKISDALEVIKDRNNELYKWIIDNEYKIIEGLDVEPLPIKLKSKSSFFSRLFKK